MFAVHPQLERDTFFVVDLELCRVLFMNNCLFPWTVLVPRVEQMREITDLPGALRHLLIDEISHVSRAMQTLFAPDKLNIAALGNQVPQLHVHVIARMVSDAAWPNPVWGAGHEAYPDAKPLVGRLAEQLEAHRFPA